MSRAYGWNACLLLGFEQTYGIPPGEGDVSVFHKIPFISSDLDSAQGLIASNVLGLGRDPTQPYQDVINVEGDVVVPVDLRNIGYWLKAVLGDPGSRPVQEKGLVWDGNIVCYHHTFNSGEVSLPSLSLELGMPEIPEFPLFTGVRANSMAFNFQRSGEAQATVNLIGQGETRQTKTKDTTPHEASYTRFSQFQGSIKVVRHEVTRHEGASPLGNVTSASLTYSNNLEKIETIRDDGKIEGVDPGVASLTGNLAIRYADNTLMDTARSGEPIDLELAYIIDSSRQLIIQCHEVYLPKPKRSISGPNGIEASYDFQGAFNAAHGNMVTVTLTNDLEGY